MLFLNSTSSLCILSWFPQCPAASCYGFHKSLRQFTALGHVSVLLQLGAGAERLANASTWMPTGPSNGVNMVQVWQVRF